MEGEKYKQKIRRCMAVGMILIVILCFLSLLIGRYSLSIKETLTVLLNGYPSGEKTVQSMIIWDVRMPRLLLAVITGAGLAAAGSAYQGIFHNYLVSPDLLGVSNGAGLERHLECILLLEVQSGQASWHLYSGWEV